MIIAISNDHATRAATARTVFARLRTDRDRAPIAALIPGLDRRADEWANLLTRLTPTKTVRAKRAQTYSASTSFTTPELADLARRADEWDAARHRCV
jgi:hypothetical protein